MESFPATRELTLANRATRIAVLGSLLLLAGGLVQTAFAANDAFIDCDELAINLRSLDVPPAELPLDSTDNITATENVDLGKVLDTDGQVSPVLLLTPRVATIMREVFDSVAIDAEVGTDEEQVADEPAADVPPVVKAPPALPAADETATNSHYMPRFQRQMYRTDI